MIKEFVESLKLKDLVFFVLIIVLFCMYFKKNKKEGFAYTSPTDATQKDTFKADVEEALGENIQAIKNLGDFAGQLLTSNNVLDLSAVDLKVKSLDVKGNSDLKGALNVDGELKIKRINDVKFSVSGYFDGVKVVGQKCISGLRSAESASAGCGYGWKDGGQSESLEGETYYFANGLKPYGHKCSSTGYCTNLHQRAYK